MRLANRHVRRSGFSSWQCCGGCARVRRRRRHAQRRHLRSGKRPRFSTPKPVGWWYVVYVPKDYTPDREWPTIFDYHGKNGDRTPGRSRNSPTGRIYHRRYGYLIGDASDISAELQNLERIRAFVSSKLKLNSRLISWAASVREDGPHRASATITWTVGGADHFGRRGIASDKATPLLQGKPVFIGIGEKDDSTRTPAPQTKRTRPLVRM